MYLQTAVNSEAAICPTNEVYKIITDDGVSRENIRKAEELDVPLVIA